MPDSPLPPGSTVAAYYRDSGGPEQERSVDQQRAAAAEYCRQNGLVLVREFADRATPGSSTIGRDAFQAMVAWLRELAPEPERGKRLADAPDAVLCWDMRRFARNERDSAFFRADLRRRGYALLFLSDRIPGGDMAPVFEAMLAWKAQQDLRDLAKDVRRGLWSRLMTTGPDGGYLNLWPGKAPAGFRGEPHEIGRTRTGKPRIVQRIVPDRGGTWERVRRAFELKAQDVPIKRIHEAVKLYASLYGYRFLFKRRIYCGDLEWGGEVVEDWIEPCVPRELWDRVQETPHRAWAMASPRSGTGRYPLTGWLRCGSCDGPMSGSTSTKAYKDRQYRYRRYHCSRASKMPDTHTDFYTHAFDIERQVFAVLAREVLTPEALFSMLEGTRPGDQERTALLAEVERLGAEVKGLERLIGRLVDQVERHGPDAGIAKRLQRRRTQKQQAASRMARLERRAYRMRSDPVPEAVIRAFCDHAQEVLLAGDVPEVRDLLRSVLESVTVWPDGRGLVRYRVAFGQDQGAIQEAEFNWCESA